MDMGCNGVDIPGGATLCSRGSNEPLDLFLQKKMNPLTSKNIFYIYIYI